MGYSLEVLRFEKWYSFWLPMEALPSAMLFTNLFSHLDTYLERATHVDASRGADRRVTFGIHSQLVE